MGIVDLARESLLAGIRSREYIPFFANLIIPSEEAQGAEYLHHVRVPDGFSMRAANSLI